MKPYNIEVEWVEEFSTPTYGRRDEGVDGHGLTANTLNDIEDIAGDYASWGGAVTVGGEHPWNYQYSFLINKSSLQNVKERYKTRLIDDGYSQDRAQERSDMEYNPVEISERIIKTVISDNNAIPHSYNYDDYEMEAELVETEESYKVQATWRPKEKDK